MTARADLSHAEQRIIDAMAWLETKRIPMPWPRHLISYAAEMRPTGGYFKTAAARLVRLGMISLPGGRTLVLEHDGRMLTEATEAELTMEALHARAMRRLEWRQKRIAEIVLPAYPLPVARSQLSQATGLKMDSVTNAIARLRSSGVIDTPTRATVVASEDMCPEQLRERASATGKPEDWR